MKNEYRFKVQTQWRKEQFENSKTHLSTVNGREDLIISAAREFKGESDKHNPEDLLLRALSSCHMMSYFYVCQQHGIEILDYKDEATGTLVLNEDASGGFQKVILNPIVTLQDAAQKEVALSLHDKAHNLCFIANSVNFEVEIQVVIKFI